MAAEDATSLHIQRSKRRVLRTKTFRLIAMLSLTFGYFVVELVVGNITNSVALVADAFHMLSDVISLVIAVVAVRISRRQSDMNTYGWVRAEVVGANINTVFLLALCLTIVFDAIKRFVEPESIENVNLLLIVGSIGLGINIIGLFLFQGFHGHSHGGMSHGHSHEHKSHGHSHNHTEEEAGKTNIAMDDISVHSLSSNKFQRHSTRALQETIAERAQELHENSDTVIEMADEKTTKPKKKASMNMHGVFLHVLADALGSVVVIISALLIKFVPHDPANTKHWTIYIDPTLSVLIVIIITISALPLFRDTTYILLQTIPKHLEIEQIKSQLLTNVPEIYGIHELHIWRLTNEKIIASAHLSRFNLSNYMLVADKVKKFFHTIGIHSVTIQYEFDDEMITANNRRSTTTKLDEPDESKTIAGDCLLRCEDDECDAQTCCTKVSDRRNIVINDENPTEIYSITQPNPSQDSLHTQISSNTEVEDKKHFEEISSS